MSNNQSSHHPSQISSSRHSEKGNQKKSDNRIHAWFRKALALLPLNLSWFALSLPIITIFPALGGLYHAVMVYQKDEPSGWRNVWEGFRKHWLISVQWGLLVLVGDLILFGSIWFFQKGTQNWHPYAAAAGVVFSIIWVAINQFSFPLLLLQKEKNVPIAIRNGYVILMRRPQEALKVLLLTLVICAVSIALPPLWILVTVGVIVQIQTRSVLRSVEKIRAADREKDAIKADHNSAEPDQEGSNQEE